MMIIIWIMRILWTDKKKHVLTPLADGRRFIVHHSNARFRCFCFQYTAKWCDNGIFSPFTAELLWFVLCIYLQAFTTHYDLLCHGFWKRDKKDFYYKFYLFCFFFLLLRILCIYICVLLYHRVHSFHSISELQIKTFLRAPKKHISMRYDGWENYGDVNVASIYYYNAILDWVLNKNSVW